jgi:hypothetical protein
MKKWRNGNMETGHGDMDMGTCHGNIDMET